MRNRSIVLAALIIAICASPAAAQSVGAAQQAEPQQASSQDEMKVVSAELMDVDILKALDTILAGTGRNYRIEDGVRVSGLVRVHLQDVPVDTAVELILRNAGLKARRENQTYVITRMPVPAVQVPVAMPQQVLVPAAMPRTGTVDVKPSGARTGGRRFDILLDKANVLEAMKQIMDVAGQNYVIDTGLDAAWAGPLGPRISSRMRGIDLDEAIQALGKSTSLVVAKVGTTYTVRPPDGAMPLAYDSGGKGSATVSSCTRCSYTLMPTWLYCPRCGNPVRMPAAVTPGKGK